MKKLLFVIIATVLLMSCGETKIVELKNIKKRDGLGYHIGEEKPFTGIGVVYFKRSGLKKYENFFDNQPKISIIIEQSINELKKLHSVFNEMESKYIDVLKIITRKYIEFPKHHDVLNSIMNDINLK